MGYELDRLMQQFGVSTPTLSYSGMPMPMKPDDLSTTASSTDKANYDALLAKYNADMPLYNSNQAMYKTYSDEYKNRLANTSLYDAPQFRRGITSSPGTGMFADQYSPVTGGQNATVNQNSYNMPTALIGPTGLTGLTGLTGTTITPAAALDLMYRASTSGASTADFDKYGGYAKVKAAATAAGFSATPEWQKSYEQSLRNTGTTGLTGTGTTGLTGTTTGTGTTAGTTTGTGTTAGTGTTTGTGTTAGTTTAVANSPSRDEIIAAINASRLEKFSDADAIAAGRTNKFTDADIVKGLASKGVTGEQTIGAFTPAGTTRTPEEITAAIAASRGQGFNDADIATGLLRYLPNSAAATAALAANPIPINKNVGGYAHGGAVHHYEFGGGVTGSMAEAQELIKALESGTLTRYEREEALSKIAEIYRKIDQEPSQLATMSMYSAPQFQRNQRAVLNEPIYNMPTALRVLQTVPKTTPYVLPYDGGNGSPAGGERSSNPAWDAMTSEEKAAFYSANPMFGAITRAGQNILGITSLGTLQNSLVPDFVREQQAIAKGTEAYSGLRNFGKESTIPSGGMISPGLFDPYAGDSAKDAGRAAALAASIAEAREAQQAQAQDAAAMANAAASLAAAEAPSFTPADYGPSGSPDFGSFSSSFDSGGYEGGGYYNQGGYVDSYAQGGAVRHYQAGGDVMSSMAEAERLIKALEGGKLTKNEREDAMSRVAEIYRRLDEEPVQAAPENLVTRQIASAMPERLMSAVPEAPEPSGGDLIQPMPESIKLTPREIEQAIFSASPLTALKETVAIPPTVAEAAPLVRPVDPRLFGESDEVATGPGYSPMDPRLYGESDEVATGKGYSPLDPRLFGETDEVATGKGYSPFDPRLFGEAGDAVTNTYGYSMPVVARAAPPAVDRTLLNLAAKYARPGFTPKFAAGSIDPGPDRMALISRAAIANKIANPVINIQPEYADDSASRLSMDKPQDTTIPMSPTMAMLQKMLLDNQSQKSPYADELRVARAAATAQTKAFNDMLEKAIKGQDDNKPSNAEMYFRLAAAFGAPTKTGNFFESLAEVNKSMAEQAKETRLAGKAGQALRLQLSLEGAKAGMTAAKEDVTALRALTSEEMKEKAAYGRDLIKEYFKSGEAQSTFGKQAQDEGLIPGTPKYQARVTAISDEALRRATAGADAAGAAAQASLASIEASREARLLAQKKFDAAQDKAKANAARLSEPELKLKIETEDMIGTTEQAMNNLRRAYALNPSTFDNSLPDLAQRKILEAAGREDPKVVATRVLENILEKAALSSLKATFPGAISDGERTALMNTVGLGSKSIEERKLIMESGYEALKSVSERAKKRLKLINEGLYRTTAPAIAEETE